MPKSKNQKLKMWYLLKILEEKTDVRHPMPMQAIREELAAFGIAAERKSIYADIEELGLLGYRISYNPSRRDGGYYLSERQFELPELKLLVDAVQSSRFITAKKSRELIEKLNSFASSYDARKLERQVYVVNRIKTENESIYLNVDEIHTAMQENRQISFQYLEWTLDKTLRPKKGGERYQVSPWALTWQDENYYLIAYDGQADMIKHYRVDKMGKLLLTGRERQGGEAFRDFDIAAYANKTFGMFGGKEETVVLRFPNALIGVALDRFGRDVELHRKEDGFFHVYVRVAVSHPFFGWLSGLSTQVRLMGPEMVVKEYQTYLDELRHNYGEIPERTGDRGGRLNTEA